MISTSGWPKLTTNHFMGLIVGHQGLEASEIDGACELVRLVSTRKLANQSVVLPDKENTWTESYFFPFKLELHALWLLENRYHRVRA